jgi:YD repeat-containing protein
MKVVTSFPFFILLTLAGLVGNAQYYYKDIVSTAESAAMLRTYRDANVRSVRVVSYDAEGVKDDNLVVVQTFDPRQSILRTLTQSATGATPTILLTYLNTAGQLVKTIDSSQRGSSTTTYTYNPAGQLQVITRTLFDLLNTPTDTEIHLWEYTAAKPARMLRIKNSRDTSIVQIKLDEEGNVSEEILQRRGLRTEPIYYYHDAQGRLTDVVRYNAKTKKLLPEIMFEYSPTGQVIQRITVPGNSSNYLIWRSAYDSRGLKTKEAVYGKGKQVQGRIEYLYSFGS